MYRKNIIQKPKEKTASSILKKRYVNSWCFLLYTINVETINVSSNGKGNRFSIVVKKKRKMEL
jgi:hypothetical protein